VLFDGVRRAPAGAAPAPRRADPAGVRGADGDAVGVAVGATRARTAGTRSALSHAEAARRWDDAAVRRGWAGGGESGRGARPRAPPAAGATAPPRANGSAAHGTDSAMAGHGDTACHGAIDSRAGGPRPRRSSRAGGDADSERRPRAPPASPLWALPTDALRSDADPDACDALDDDVERGGGARVRRRAAGADGDRPRPRRSGTNWESERDVRESRGRRVVVPRGSTRPSLASSSSSWSEGA
jgi:hypothetical protein